MSHELYSRGHALQQHADSRAAMTVSVQDGRLGGMILFWYQGFWAERLRLFVCKLDALQWGVWEVRQCTRQSKGAAGCQSFWTAQPHACMVLCIVASYHFITSATYTPNTGTLGCSGSCLCTRQSIASTSFGDEQVTHAFTTIDDRHASKVCSVQVQATTSAYAASLHGALGSTSEPGADWDWPDATSLQPTCNLTVKALGLSKKVLHSNTIKLLSRVINNA